MSFVFVEISSLIVFAIALKVSFELFLSVKEIQRVVDKSVRIEICTIFSP